MQTHCPHCNSAVEIAADDSLIDIACDTCGSGFSLVNDEETTAKYDGGPNQTIGHFELLELLGQGTFGSVWKARDTELDRDVAVKLPRREHLNRVESERFFREARAAAQLRHPGIVAVHEVGNEDGQLYIVSEFILGATLKEWREAHSPSARDSAVLTRKFAEALQHAHQHGVVHRDLKPGNILIDGESNPHIADFGLAKRDAGEVTMTVEGQILGTPAFMPPEQARGEGHAVDARGDIYSLGVTLFQLLTGELPFRGSAKMMIMQILNDEPPSPRKLKSGIPRDLETITLKCMQKDPARRYQQADEVADDLKRWLAGEPILARPIGRVERAVRWVRRNPLAAGLSLAVAVLLTAVAIVSSVFGIRQSRLADGEREARTDAETNLKLSVVARDAAEANLRLALRAVEVFLSQVGDKDLSDVPLMQPVRKRLLAKAKEFYDELLKGNPTSPELRLEYGRAQHRLGEVLAELGDRTASEAAYRRAVETLKALSEEHPLQAEYRHHLARAIGFLAELLRTVKEGAPEAERQYRAAIALQNMLLNESRSNAKYQREWTRSWNNLGFLLKDAGRFDEANAALDKAITGCRELSGRESQNLDYRADLAQSLINRGTLLTTKEKTRNEARDDYEDAIVILKTIVGAAAQKRGYRRKLAIAHLNLGNLNWRIATAEKDTAKSTRLLNQARQACEAAVAILRQLRADYREIPSYARDLANVLNSQSNILIDLKLNDQAASLWREALDVLQKTEQAFPVYVRSRPEYQSVWGTVLGSFAWYHDELAKDPREARRLTESAIERQANAARGNPDNPQYREKLQNHYLFLVGLLVRANEQENAVVKIAEGLKAGVFRKEDLSRKSFGALRSRDDFQRLLD